MSELKTLKQPQGQAFNFRMDARLQRPSHTEACPVSLVRTVRQRCEKSSRRALQAHHFNRFKSVYVPPVRSTSVTVSTPLLRQNQP